MTQDHQFSRLRDQIAELIFNHPKQLRQAAEQLGYNFVRIQVVQMSDDRAHFLLRPPGMSQVHVFAKRDRHWYPFRVTEVRQETG